MMEENVGQCRPQAESNGQWYAIGGSGSCIGLSKQQPQKQQQQQQQEAYTSSLAAVTERRKLKNIN